MGLRYSASLLTFAYNNKLTLQNPDYDGHAITASDSVDLGNGPTKALYVTVGGNISVNLAGGGTAVLTSVVAGQILPIAVTRVLATGTTATGIVALYN